MSVDAALYPAVSDRWSGRRKGSKEKTGCCFYPFRNHVLSTPWQKAKENNIPMAIRRICFMDQFSG